MEKKRVGNFKYFNDNKYIVEFFLDEIRGFGKFYYKNGLIFKGLFFIVDKHIIGK